MNNGIRKADSPKQRLMKYARRVGMISALEEKERA